MKKKTARILSAFLFFVFLIPLASIFVSSYDFDFSYQSAPLKTVIYADEFLEDNLGISMSNTEKQYLKTQSGFEISFNSHIPTTSVDVDYDIESDLLKIRAKEYKYTASNGASVVWKPVSANLASDRKVFQDSTYTVEFAGVSHLEAETVEVEFATEFTVDEKTVNELLNLAYFNAPLHEEYIKFKNEEYERLTAEYLLNVEKYECYLLLLEAYNEYLSEKRIYDEKYAEYSKYISELEEYNRLKAEYDEYIFLRDKYYTDYARYLDYLAYASVNQNKIDAYEKYTRNLEHARAQLDIIKSTKRKATSLNRDVYGAIMGDTVTSVIENKDAIANNLTGADPGAVDKAGIATSNLRILFTDFFALTDENEQYNYYVTNYEAFRDNFVDLFRSLDKLYMNGKVRGVLKSQDKQEKYVILLAELYYVCNALSDEPVKNYDGTAFYDSNYIVGKGYIDEKSPIDIMEGEIYVSDTDSASPLQDGYPMPVEKPEYTKMEEPVMPKLVLCPVEPESVPEPKAPKPVEKPVIVENPGKAPVEHVPDKEVVEIIKAYNNGLLAERDMHSGDVKISPKISVTKKFYNLEFVTATFYDREYNDERPANVLYQITVDKGTYVDYAAPVPQKNEDSRYEYVHFGWTDSKGNEVDFSRIDSDIDLYPSFSKIEKEYTTAWVVDGMEYTEEPQNPTKNPSANICYIFDGWHESIDYVTMQITLTAVFKERYLLETDYGAAEIQYTDSSIVAIVGTAPGPYPMENIIQNAAGKCGITLQTAKGTLSFSYSETLSMKKNGVSAIDLFVIRRLDGEYSYSFKLFDASGNEMPSQIKANATVPCVTEDPQRLELFYSDGGEKKLVRGVFNESGLSFVAVNGRLYSTSLSYTVASIPIENVEILITQNSAKPGEGIGVLVSAPPGIRIDRIYLMNSSGEKHDIVGGSFVMPSDDVTIGVDYVVEEYVVTFVSDGKTIATFKCRYGETVTPPKAPQKASTDNFEYTFIGWSEEVVPVTCSVVYTAVYARKVISSNTDDSGLQISESVMKLILLAATVGGVVLLVIIPSCIMTIIVVKRRKSKLKIKSRR